MTGGGYHIISSSLNSKASVRHPRFPAICMVRKDYGSADLNIDVEDGGAATDLLVSGNIAEVFSSGLSKSGAGRMVSQEPTPTPETRTSMRARWAFSAREKSTPAPAGPRRR